MTAVAATALSQVLPRTMPVRAFLVGGRLDTRGLERREPIATSPLTLRLAEGGVAVLFRYGVAVLIDAAPGAEAGLLQRLSPYVVDPAAVQEADEVRLQISPDADEQIDSSGTIILKQENPERLQLVADVLAKNLILTHYETRIAGIFDRIEPLAATLKTKGRAGAAGADLLRQIGDVLLIQHKMVGRVETDEKPELLWENPELERLYLRLADEYELRERSRALDRKLDVISRTVETLLGLVQSRSSLRVEWYILLLIVAEVVLLIYQLTFTS